MQSAREERAAGDGRCMCVAVRLPGSLGRAGRRPRGARDGLRLGGARQRERSEPRAAGRAPEAACAATERARGRGTRARGTLYFSPLRARIVFPCAYVPQTSSLLPPPSRPAFLVSSPLLALLPSI